MENEEWGPWIKHDGGKCPLKAGQVAKFRCRNGLERVWVNGGSSFQQDGTDYQPGPEVPIVNIWLWKERPLTYWFDAMEYQIKKPKGLTILENLIASLPTPVKQLQLTP